MPQGDEEWLQARVGKVTASRMGDMMAKTKSGWGASREQYAAELLSELINGKPYQGYVTGPMAQGILNEPDARVEYEFEKGVRVEEVGFIPHPNIHRAGASPDGYVGSEGLIEIKCMQPSGHVAVLRTLKISDSHIKQMQFQMACTGRQWCDYVAYNPNYNPPYRCWISRVYRDENLIRTLEDHTRIFLQELDLALADLRAKHERERAA